MYIKKIIQLFLFLILILITTIVFFEYFFKKKNLNEDIINIHKKTEPELDEKTANLIKDIKYFFSDIKGNDYEIFSEYGRIDINNPDVMFMTNVTATVFLADGAPVKITSKFANYNKNNHETNFFTDVLVTYKIHKAKSENLDLSFNTNLISMYNNIIYNKPGTELLADRLEIDLITKNSKIFMDNKSEKIKIVDK